MRAETRVRAGARSLPPIAIPRLKEIIRKSPTIFTIGVAGDSGSGKTTFTNAIREIFGADLVSTITLDDYHTLDREQRREKGVTPLAPEANDFQKLEEDIRDLKEGKTIQKPVYNHINGTLEPPVPFSPTKIVILEGLHAFFTPVIRELTDFKIFVNPEPDVKRYWKIKRDMEIRGYRREEVMEELEARERDYEKYVAPQQKYADALIKIAFSKFGEDLGPVHDIYRVSICQSRLEETIKDIDLTFDLFALLSLSERDFLLEFSREEIAEREMGVITFDGELRYDVVEKLEDSIEQQVQSPPESIYRNRSYITPTEMGQLLVAWRIINRRFFMEESFV
ncbi:MAG TPA: phosphoribulokinase [Methanomicrobiales archaeon]|nr:phosphoribulokinase [Methanomicrobiales archaeon]